MFRTLGMATLYATVLALVLHCRVLELNVARPAAMLNSIFSVLVFATRTTR